MPVRGGSRGRKKPSLQDLSRQLPSSDEFQRIITEIHGTDPRAAALVLASVIDNLLEISIRLNFVPLDDRNINALFRNPTAPLSSFSTKIAVAHALGVYSDTFRKQLDKLRAIRNTFAHAMVSVDFDEPLIAEECRHLDPASLVDGQYQPETDSPRERFTIVGIIILTHLVRYNDFMYKGHTFGTLPWPSPFPDKFEVRRLLDFQNLD